MEPIEIMHLWRNQTLQLLILLAFLFELAPPVFAPDTSSLRDTREGTHLNTPHHQKLFSPYASEESNENEEERNGKESTFSHQYYVVPVQAQNVFIHRAKVASFISSIHQSVTFSGLFRTLRKLII